MTIFGVISLCGGVALLMYGMNIMGSALEKAAGGKVEGILRRITSSTLKGVLLGAGITALIQSSAGTTVVVIGLVNSNIISFGQAIGVIMGANIGTTVTGQIIRLADITGGSVLLEFIKPTTLAPIAAFIGAILFVFFKSPKKRNFGQILMGFGILFTGIFTIEAAVYPLRDSPWFLQLFSSLQNPFLGVLAGAVVTMLIQSSSASVGILQALSATGVVTWGSAIPIILGQNIGTTSTGLLASTGASKGARRVAVTHVYFNVIGTVLFLGVIYIIKYTVGIPFWNSVMDKGDIANFHTLFNVVVTFLFIPFKWVLVKLAEWTVPEKPGGEHPELTPTILDERLFTSPSVAIAQARKALAQMANLGHLNQHDAVPLLSSHSAEGIRIAEQREDVIDKLDVSATNYLIKLAELDLTEEESRDVTSMLNTVTEFERIGDYAISVVRRSGMMQDKDIVFSDNAKTELAVLNEAMDEILQLTIQAFTHADLEDAARVEPLEETIDAICETLRERHIARLKRSECSIDAGIVFLEILNDYERISDHCSNVAARMVSASLDSDYADPHELRRDLHAGNREEYNQLADVYRGKYYNRIREVEEGDAGACELPAAPDAE